MYKPINGYTKEKIIETLEKKIKRRAYSDHYGDCRYRMDDGAVCAVGAFIPDQEYKDKMEGESARTLIENFSQLAGFMPLETHAMQKLQHIHDSSGDKDVQQRLVDWVKENVE